MANPQTENGHIEIANDIWEALMGGGFKKNEYRIIFCVLRYSYGVKNKYANLRKKEISILTRVPLPKVNETLTSLEKKNVLRISQTNGYIYFHKDYEKWQLNETLIFNDKWKLQVNETLTKNLMKREVELNETGSETSQKLNKQEGFIGSKESKESIKEKNTTTDQKEKIYFDLKLKIWVNLLPEDFDMWGSAYPSCNIEIELKQMGQWLLSNPDKRKKNYRRFVTNWLARSQERGGTKGLANSEKVPEATPKTEEEIIAYQKEKSGWSAKEQIMEAEKGEK